jgi:hypothetical protein
MISSGSYCDLFENHMPLFAINVYLKLLTMNSTRDNPSHSLLVGKHPLTCSDPDSAPTIVMNLAMFKQTLLDNPIQVLVPAIGRLSRRADFVETLQ